MFLGDKVFQLGAHGAEQAVTTENAEKRAHQGRADVVAQHFRGLVDLAHGQHHAQHAGHDAHARHGFGHVAHGMGRQDAFLAHGGDVHVHEAVDVRRVAGGQVDAQGVADEVDDPGVLGHVGVFAENGTGFRLFHVAFNTDDAFAVHLGKQRVKQGQGFQIARFAGAGVREQMLQAFDDQAESVLGLGTKERAQTAPQNNDEFRRLEKYAPFAVGQGVAGKHRGRNDGKTY